MNSNEICKAKFVAKIVARGSCLYLIVTGSEYYYCFKLSLKRIYLFYGQLDYSYIYWQSQYVNFL